MPVPSPESHWIEQYLVLSSSPTDDVSRYSSFSSEDDAKAEADSMAALGYRCRVIDLSAALLVYSKGPA